MEFIKKLTIGLLVGWGLMLLSTVGMEVMEVTGDTSVFHITYDSEITINSRTASADPFSMAPYKTMDSFVSEEHVSEFPFTSVGGYWEEYSPEGTNVDAEIRFETGGEWSDWLDLEEEIDMLHLVGEEEGYIKKSAIASTNEAEKMQYRFLMYGDGLKSPVIKNAKWTFIKSGGNIHTEEAPTPNYSSSSMLSHSTYLALNYGKTDVISRSAWGADESYRYLSENTSDPVLINVADDYYEKYKDELQYSRIVDEDSKGKDYKWPLQYPENVSKIVVHHTASTSNLDNPKQAIRDMYHYHAVTRGWGDIGYNYIIDSKGKVYEGRYGGEGVIGAHAGTGNHGSIGIAVMGNYESDDVPQAVIDSLSRLIYEKSKAHGIDPEGVSLFRGEELPNVVGHKDVMATTCPGVNLYEKLPVVRLLAAQYKAQDKKKFVKDYDYQDHSDVFYLELNPGETREVELELENIGKMDWSSSSFIVVDQHPSYDGVISFPSMSGVRLANVDGAVKSGKTGTFKFKIKAGTKGDTVELKIAPLMSGTKKARDYITIPVTVLQSDFKYSYIDSKYPSKSLEKGETINSWVKLKNTGNIVWARTGENKVVLAADHDRNRISQFVKPSSKIIGTLQDTEVAPGEIGTFSLSLTAPSGPGYYREYFTPYVPAEDLWMKDTGLNFASTVYSGNHAAQLEKIISIKNWEAGRKYMVKVKIRNLGQSTWTNKNLKATFLKRKSMNISGATLEEKEVNPGELGTLTFYAQSENRESEGSYSIAVKPKIGNTYLLPMSAYVRYKILEDTSAGSSIEDIRVKLSYSGSPEIEGSGDFDLYAGDEYLKSLSKGETVSVEKKGVKYIVDADGSSFTKIKPIRLVSRGNTILEISNFENRPAWNTSLNDNQYRGVLEVRIVDGKLVVINELSLERYLKGLGEVSNSEEVEKIKAIMVAARTYAYYYMTQDEKFPGKPYHVDDDPKVSQKYLGYGLEKRSPNVANGVVLTEGEVVTYNGAVVKTPYFNKSDGDSTKSAEEVWGWKTTPYLLSVSDSYCDSTSFNGHGVGLSGCGAKGMALKGYDYKEILSHYYTKTKITDLY